MKILPFIVFLFLLFYITCQNDEEILTGTMISSDVNSNLIKYAFDGDVNTQFMTKNSSYGWVGRKFPSKYIITRIEWAQAEDDHNNYLLGVFEGANTKNFLDAVPLYMIITKGKIREINSIDIDFKKKFEYFRYVGPSGKYCKISHLMVYGYSDSESDSNYYQPTNLPFMVIHSISGEEPQNKDDLFDCSFYLFNNKKIDIYEEGQLSLKGIDSLKIDKKSYNIVFEDTTKPLDFNSKSKRWALLGNYGDKTLLRNLLTFEISKIFNMTFTVDCKPIDLMLNGEFKGTYNLCEKIEVLENRLNIKKLTKNDNSLPKMSGGYLIEVNGFAYLGDLYFNSRKGVPVSIKYPQNDDISKSQRNYIKEKFDELELEIYNNNLTNIDMTSFVKFFLIEELIGNAEAYWSTFLYKERNDDKFYFGPIWDSDMTYDNDIRVYPINCKTHYIFNSGLSAGTMDKFINQIIKNENVINKIKEVWKEITENKLNVNYLDAFIDEQIELLMESKNLNFMRWDILSKKVSFNPKVYFSYLDEINNLKDFIKIRIDWLSNYILKENNEIKITCDSTEVKTIKSELNYEMDNSPTEVEVDYQLLSNSYKYFGNNIFFIIIILLFM